MRSSVASICFAAIITTASLCAHAQSSSSAAATSAPATEENAEQTKVYASATLVNAGKPDEALQQAEQAVAGYEARFGGEKEKLFSARSQAETLLYLVEAANTQTGARVVEWEYGYAYYFMGYALVELGRIDDAIPAFLKAIALAPRNSQFLAELGNAYQSAKDWPNAVAAYRKAEAATEFSPENVKKKERGRAWRGMGFAYVELGRLDDAEAVYKLCLEIDPGDGTAASELVYVQDMRSKVAQPESRMP